MGATFLMLVVLVAQPKSEPTTNEKILAFSQDNLGKKVGDGECGTLAVKAVQFAKAKRLPPYGGDATVDFVWGDLVATFNAKNCPSEKIKIGDVLQFRDAKFTSDERSTLAPHHTAIVAKVKDGVVSVLHQNVGDGKKRYTVQPGEYDMRNLKEGWVKAYRTLPLGKPEMTKVKYKDPIAIEFHRLLNKERSDRGLNALKLNEETGAAALKLSKIKDGSKKIDGLVEALLEVGYQVKSGTSGSMGGGLNANGIFQAAMKSEAGKKIFLDPNYTDLGLWLVRTNNGCTITYLLSSKDEM